MGLVFAVVVLFLTKPALLHILIGSFSLLTFKVIIEIGSYSLLTFKVIIDMHVIAVILLFIF